MAKKKKFVQNPGNSAIAYYRYSSEAQRDVSINQQREEAHRYADEHGYSIIREYEDHAISGMDDDRPQFKLMLNEAPVLKPAYLILWKTDRLSRDRNTASNTKEFLRSVGVELKYIAEPIPDGDESARIVIESIYEAVAHSFIIQHTRNVERGLNYNAEKALYNGVKVLGYKGVPDHRYEIDEDGAVIVRRIFEEYTNGISLQKLANGLNESGLRSALGRPFTVNSIRHIIMNRSYIGEYHWGEHVVPDGMPRLVSDEMFEEARKRLDKNKRGKKASKDEDIKYLLTGHHNRPDHKDLGGVRVFRRYTGKICSINHHPGVMCKNKKNKRRV